MLVAKWDMSVDIFSGVDMRALSERQREIVSFLHEYQGQHGAPPSVREVQARFGFHSNTQEQKHR
jgi:SOS-response transcriptional repressor LexA